MQEANTEGEKGCCDHGMQVHRFLVTALLAEDGPQPRATTSALLSSAQPAEPPW